MKHGHFGWEVKEIDVRASTWSGWCVTFLDELDTYKYPRLTSGEYQHVTPASLQRVVRLVQGWPFTLDVENERWTFVRPEKAA